MKRNLFWLLILAAILPGRADADWYVPGGWTSGAFWNPSSNPMTNMGGGIYEIAISGQNPNARYEFKVLGEAGNWGSSATNPDGSNSWGWTDATGTITIRLDENSLGNGYLADTNRITVANDRTSWNVVGDFMVQAGGGSNWENGNSLFTMTSLGGGAYEYMATISTAGSYEGKFVNSGSWDGIGREGRTVNATNFLFTTTTANEIVKFSLNTNWGAGNISSVPEPSGLFALSTIALAGLGFRKRRS